MTLQKPSLETSLYLAKISVKSIGYLLFKAKIDTNEGLRLLQKTADEIKQLEEEISDYEYEQSLRDSKL